MFTRSLIFEGRIHAGREEDFFRIVRDDLLPIWHRMPNARDVRVFRPIGCDPGSPEIAMVQQIDYPTLEAVEEAVASPVRAEGRIFTDQLMTMFEGRFYHFVYERTVGQALGGRTSA